MQEERKSQMKDRGPWITTYRGTRWYLTDPDAAEIDIVDIAHSLANLCRWVGHTKSHFSVAQHSVIIEMTLEDPVHRLQALLHDAPEAYLGEVSRPLKGVLGHAYKDLEYKTWVQVARKFLLPVQLDPAIKQRDYMITLDEKDLLFLPEISSDPMFQDSQFGIARPSLLEAFPDKVGIKDFEPWSPQLAEATFMWRLQRALGEYDGVPF